MNTSTLPTEIVAFAAAVRASLSDLPADEVEELTDGLEADLAEAYAEDLARELPDPAAYADELRGAAGLPTPEAVTKTGRVRPIVDAFAATGRDLQRSLRANAFTAAAWDFVVTLRPAWWIVRGWAAYQAVDLLMLGAWKTNVLPPDLPRWILLVVMVVGSVFVGLRRWPAWVRHAIVVGNAVAVWVLVAAFANVATAADVMGAYDEGEQNSYSGQVMQGPDGTGVYLNGSEVTNIFAYDAKGRRLDGVQLFDQDGKPVATSVPGGNGCLEKSLEDDTCATPGAWLPTQLETGATAWNVYPMQMAESSFESPMTPLDGVEAQDRPAPFVKVPALMSMAQEDEAAQAAKGAKKKAEKTP